MSILRTRNETVGVFDDLPALQKTAEDLEKGSVQNLSHISSCDGSVM